MVYIVKVLTEITKVIFKKLYNFTSLPMESQEILSTCIFPNYEEAIILVEQKVNNVTINLQYTFLERASFPMFVFIIL